MTSARCGPMTLGCRWCVFAAICTEVLPVGLLPEIGRGLRVSAGTAGLLVSIYAVLVAVMSVPIAALAERWPRRIVLAGAVGRVRAEQRLSFAVAPDYAVAMAGPDHRRGRPRWLLRSLGGRGCLPGGCELGWGGRSP